MTRTALPGRHLAFLVLITLIWGFNLIASRVGTQHFPPLFFTALRFSAIGLVLLPFLRWHPGRMPQLMLAAVLSGGLQFALLFTGLRLAPDVGSVAIASQLGVPFTTLLSVAFLGEVVHWRRWIGIALAFAGVAVIAVRGPLTVHGGVALVVAAALISSTGLIAVKRLGTHLEPLELQAWFAWSGLPLLWLLSAALEHGQWASVSAARPLDWAALAYTVLIASLIGHTGFYWLVRRHPVTSLAPVLTLSPLFSILFGIVLLGERASPRLALGGLLTLAGVTIISLREHRLVDTGS